MNLYLLLKFAHVISSTILFGTGIGTAMTLFLAHRTREAVTIAIAARYVVLADWMFTSTSGVIQLLTGLALAYVAGYPFSSLWITLGFIGYCIALFCWLPVVYLQIKMRDIAMQTVQAGGILPPLYFRYFKYWFCLGWPAFISLLAVFYVMIAKPS